jgi:hypothetical protein
MCAAGTAQQTSGSRTWPSRAGASTRLGALSGRRSATTRRVYRLRRCRTSRATGGNYDRRKCAQLGAAGIEPTYAAYDGPVP